MKKIDINFRTDLDIIFGMEWEGDFLPAIGNSIVFATMLSSTDIDSERDRKIIKKTVFQIEDMMWENQNEVTIFLKKNGEIN